ncbi:MAG TPA: hypothetical protein VE890_01880 [Thermoguttaceae bacterium]|nr:hypothetical protein [Thermoguttaceae bacterium]
MTLFFFPLFPTFPFSRNLGWLDFLWPPAKKRAGQAQPPNHGGDAIPSWHHSRIIASYFKPGEILGRFQV